MEKNEAEAPPKTFEELRRWKKWRAVLNLLRRTQRTISIAASEEAMGQYCAVVISGQGFCSGGGRAAFQAAFAGSNDRFRPIRSLAKMREKIREYDDSLPEEGKIVADILAEAEALLAADAKERAGRRRRAA